METTLGKLALERVALLLHLPIGDTENLRRENRRVLRSGLPDGHRRHGDARGHLNDRVQRIDSLEMRTGERNADHGQRGQGRHDSGEVRRHPRAADQHAEASLTRRFREFSRALRSSVRGRHDELVLDSELVEVVEARLHRLSIAFAAVCDANAGGRVDLHVAR
jgi:hypothetical protein